MNILLNELTSDQRDLLEIVWKGYRKCGQWPFYQYVEAEMSERHRDVLTVLRSFPAIAEQGLPGSGYRAVFCDNAGRTTPSANSKIKLTVAGMRWMPENARLPEDFVRLVCYLIQERRSAPYGPDQVVAVNVSRERIAEMLYPGSAPDQVFMRMNALHGLLRHEPATWVGVHDDPSNPEWWHDLGPQILAYTNVADVDQYLDRVAEMYAPPRPVTPWVAPPQDGLVKAVDFLDAVWRLRFKGQPLIKLHSAERTAKLASDADDAEAFDSRMTALSDLLAHLQVQGVFGTESDRHPLARLAQFLVPRLVGANSTRIEAAAHTLRLVKAVRNGLQHANASADAAGALVELGIGYPISDWVRAWNIVRVRTTDAFDTIREEIQVSQRATAK